MDEGLRSFYEGNARQRARGLFDHGSIVEILPPQERVTSPHLTLLGLPLAFDDGVMIGQATIGGHNVFFASQEPGFMGGSVGEVHGAKLTGLLRKAAQELPEAVVLLLDTGGVRLHEANAGLIAISEIQRAVFQVRDAGVPVIVVCGGSNGCYGGLGIVARGCDHVVITEEGRLSVSGPEVIESQCGVEEFDSSDRALVWRTMGGKHRYLMGEASAFARDTMIDIRGAVIPLIGKASKLTLESVKQEHIALGSRLQRFGALNDATDIWAELGIEAEQDVSVLSADEFLGLANSVRERLDA